MNEYIVDATIIIQHLITESMTAHADALFDEVGNTVTLHAPVFCLLEATNVIWKHVRFQRMPISEAEILVADLVALPITISPVEDLLPRALQIGLAHQLAVYDSVYIALAEKLKLPLITVDARQSNAASARPPAEAAHRLRLASYTPLTVSML
jgi:predicted nucleic acid-binding protein